MVRFQERGSNGRSDGQSSGVAGLPQQGKNSKKERERKKEEEELMNRRRMRLNYARLVITAHAKEASSKHAEMMKQDHEAYLKKEKDFLDNYNQ